MKNYILLHNPYDIESVRFKEQLDAQGFKYCTIQWYGSSEDEAIRLINMHLTGAMEGLAPAEPEIEYTAEDIEQGTYPQEFTRWVRNCECHKGEFYEGPCPRAFPSLIAELDDGSYGLWDTPLSIEACTPETVSWKCLPGECLAGQWIESAKACALSPHWSNAVIRQGVKNYIKKYETIALPQDARILVERQQKKEGTCQFSL